MLVTAEMGHNRPFEDGGYTLHLVDFVTQWDRVAGGRKIEVYATNLSEMLTYCRARA